MSGKAALLPKGCRYHMRPQCRGKTQKTKALQGQQPALSNLKGATSLHSRLRQELGPGNTRSHKCLENCQRCRPDSKGCAAAGNGGCRIPVAAAPAARQTTEIVGNKRGTVIQSFVWIV